MPSTATTTRTQVPVEKDAVYKGVMLDALLPEYVYGRFGLPMTLEKNGGTFVARVRRYNIPDAGTTAFTAGTTPSAVAVTSSEWTITAARYGAHTIIAEDLTDSSMDNVVFQTAGALGKAHGKQLDTITRNILAAATNISYGAQANRVAITAADTIKVAYIKQIAHELSSADVPKLSSLIDPTTGTDTHPVPPSYFAFVHPDVVYDLTAETGFIAVEKYADPKSAVKVGERLVEVGSLCGVRFIETSNAPMVADGGAGGTVDIYQTIFVGFGAYSTVTLDDNFFKVRIKGPGSAGTEDPHDQRSSVAVDSYWAAVINDQTRIWSYESASSVGANT
jgi:N4-gp56 family major capsid protein